MDFVQMHVFGFLIPNFHRILRRISRPDRLFDIKVNWNLWLLTWPALWRQTLLFFSDYTLLVSCLWLSVI